MWFNYQRNFYSSIASSNAVKDLIVLGGGSGGLALAKEASKLGASVTLFDYVRPSPHGAKWGLGGTCVNVGCVPKKLMHCAGLLGNALREECSQYGWPVQHQPKVDWDRLRSTIQDYIKRLNFTYKNGLKSAAVEYINASASFVSENAVEFVHKGEAKVLEASTIAVAVGGRPYIPKIPGSEYCITSDDIFSLVTPPGNTLIIGGSYVALECAGFLNDLGYAVSLCVRSIPLRGFDRQCADMVLDHLVASGAQLYNCEPIKVTKNNDELTVTLSNGEDIKSLNNVVICVGRRPELAPLNLARLPERGPTITTKGYIQVDEEDQTTTPGVFAIGDVTGRVELTPVAIKAGELLARRLYGGSAELMNYESIPTTVFTSVEYGCCGFSQEKAEEMFDKENVEVFLREFDPLVLSVIEHPEPKEPSKMKDPTHLRCLAKLICHKKPNGTLPIVGVHFVGPNAGEIIQGLALAVSLRADKKDLDRLIGIHPTNAEVFTQLDITLKSGLDYKVAGGCGGGKCG